MADHKEQFDYSKYGFRGFEIFFSCCSDHFKNVEELCIRGCSTFFLFVFLAQSGTTPFGTILRHPFLTD